MEPWISVGSTIVAILTAALAAVQAHSAKKQARAAIVQAESARSQTEILKEQLKQTKDQLVRDEVNERLTAATNFFSAVRLLHDNTRSAIRDLNVFSPNEIRSVEQALQANLRQLKTAIQIAQALTPDGQQMQDFLLRINDKIRVTEFHMRETLDNGSTVNRSMLDLLANQFADIDAALSGLESQIQESVEQLRISIGGRT